MKKTFPFLTALWLFSVTAEANTEQFVSLTLCSDRLLIEIARPEQIASPCRLTQQIPLMMLIKLIKIKPTLEPRLSQLLPYLDKTILINERFYPQLVTALTQLKVKIISRLTIAPKPQNSCLLILQLGQLTDNRDKAEQLVAQLKSKNFQLNQMVNDTLILAIPALWKVICQIIKPFCNF